MRRGRLLTARHSRGVPAQHESLIVPMPAPAVSRLERSEQRPSATCCSNRACASVCALRAGCAGGAARGREGGCRGSALRFWATQIVPTRHLTGGPSGSRCSFPQLESQEFVAETLMAMREPRRRDGRLCGSALPTRLDMRAGRTDSKVALGLRVSTTSFIAELRSRDPLQRRRYNDRDCGAAAIAAKRSLGRLRALCVAMSSLRLMERPLAKLHGRTGDIAGSAMSPAANITSTACTSRRCSPTPRCSPATVARRWLAPRPLCSSECYASCAKHCRREFGAICLLLGSLASGR